MSVQEVNDKVEQAYEAWLKFRHFTQEQLDAIVERVAAVARQHSRRLAELAVQETGYGNVRDKLAKNLLNADWLPRRMRELKCVGLLREDPEQKIVEIGVPVGVVAAIIPTTNPTSTAIFKILICLKSGNGIVISPHPRARQCTCETAELLRRAAEEAGAPAGLIQCLSNPTKEATEALMKHRRTAVILSTGGLGIVKAAYSSGKPAFGVGPGNVAVLIDRTANIPEAVRKVVEGKKFDYGTVCSSEQTIVAEQALRATILNELKAQKAYICNEQEKEALRKILILPGPAINPECVGQAPTKLAQMAGFSVPEDTSILVVELDRVGREETLSMEKLSPVLAAHFVKDWPSALDACETILNFGGRGHTCVIYSQDEDRIREFGQRMPAYRVLVNTQGPHGSVGITTNLFPSMTLGCGAVGGNITSDNIGPMHLINIKRIAYEVRRPEEAFVVPEVEEQKELAGATLSREAIVAAVERYLASRGIQITAEANPVSSRSASEKPSQPAVTEATLTRVAEEIVDRLLASSRISARPRTPLADVSASSSIVSMESSGPCLTAAMMEPPGTSKVPPASSDGTQQAQPVDFVCEEDVRKAIQENRKIFINRKTIITPAARDLAAQFDILVRTDA